MGGGVERMKERKGGRGERGGGDDESHKNRWQGKDSSWKSRRFAPTKRKRI